MNRIGLLDKWIIRFLDLKQVQKSNNLAIEQSNNQTPIFDLQFKLM